MDWRQFPLNGPNSSSSSLNSITFRFLFCFSLYFCCCFVCCVDWTRITVVEGLKNIIQLNRKYSVVPLRPEHHRWWRGERRLRKVHIRVGVTAAAAANSSVLSVLKPRGHQRCFILRWWLLCRKSFISSASLSELSTLHLSLTPSRNNSCLLWK